MSWGELNVKGFGKNYFKGGETQEVLQQKRQVLGQTSAGTHLIWGESDAKGFDGKQTHSIIS